MTTTQEAGYELHAAGVLAGDPGQAWLRLWVQTLVLRPAPSRRRGRRRGEADAGWLEAVLSWPQRFIRPDPSAPGPADPDVRGTATG